LDRRGEGRDRDFNLPQLFLMPSVSRAEQVAGTFLGLDFVSLWWSFVVLLKAEMSKLWHEI
jgi:uncharacterized membrane protein